MKKLIDFPDIIIKKVEETMQFEGHKNFTAAVISMISAYYNKEYFDKRRVAGMTKKILQPENELTPEQKCEMVGGKVINNNGIPTCRIPTVGESAALVPLSDHKYFKNYFKK